MFVENVIFYKVEIVIFLCYKAGGVVPLPAAFFSRLCITRIYNITPMQSTIISVLLTYYIVLVD